MKQKRSWKHLINRNMGCIEIWFFLLQIKSAGQINRNMGCIEIRDGIVISGATTKINRNMGCIEITNEKPGGAA